MDDDDLLAQFDSARHPERSPGHPVPDGVDDARWPPSVSCRPRSRCSRRPAGTCTRSTAAQGQADLELQQALEHLREAGHRALADEIDQVLVGRDVVPGPWTYQIVESYDRTYYDIWKAAPRSPMAERLADGTPHLAESSMKVEEQSRE